MYNTTINTKEKAGFRVSKTKTIIGLTLSAIIGITPLLANAETIASKTENKTNTTTTQELELETESKPSNTSSTDTTTTNETNNVSTKTTKSDKTEEIIDDNGEKVKTKTEDTSQTPSDNKSTEESVPTLADTLVSYAYSRPVSFDEGQNPGTSKYMEIFNKIAPNDTYPRSCDRTIAIAIKYLGLDSDFPMGDSFMQLNYCLAHPEKWQHVTDFQSSGTGDNALEEAREAGLEPGDILLTDYCSLVYVGTEAVNEGYKKNIYGTDGDVGEPFVNSAWVSGSTGFDENSSKAPGISTGNKTCLYNYSVFRWQDMQDTQTTSKPVIEEIELETET